MVSETDFGMYLHELLKKYNVNLLQLKNKMGIKSKNTFYRLFENKYSYEKSKELLDQMLLYLSIDKEEEEKLYALLPYCKLNIHMREAIRILIGLYKKHIGSFNKHPIISFLEKYKNTKIKLYIGINGNTDLFRTISMWLEKYPDKNVEIDHIVNFNQPEDIIANEIYGLSTLFSYKKYNCYETKNYTFSIVMAMAELDDEFAVAVYDDVWENSDRGKSDKAIRTRISKDMAEYFDSRMKGHYKEQIKKHKGLITNYSELIEIGMDGENWDFFGFSGAPCFMNLSLDTIMELLKDSNYFNIPPEHEIIQTLISSLKTRFAVRDKSNSVNKYIFTEELMEEFISDGIIPDSVPEFRNINEKERLEVIDLFFNDKKEKKYSGRLMKSDYKIGNIAIGCFKEQQIYLSDWRVGYCNEYSEARITHPKAVKMYQQFMEYCWENITLSDEESKIRMKEMINKYIYEKDLRNAL